LLNNTYVDNNFCGLHLPVNRGKYQNWLKVLQNPLEKFFCLDGINRVYAQATTAPDQWQFLADILKGLTVDYQLAPEDLSHIPTSGPVVVVANHPFGGVEGVILPTILGTVRQDVKIMANYVLRPVTELRDLFIYVDPFGSKDSARANLASLKEALLWLKQGGLLGVFPAGEVSHPAWPKLEITDPVWSRTVARLILKSGADAVPIFFAGQNSPLFQCLGLIHPLLRTALLPREVLNKRGKTIQVKVGQAIEGEKLQSLGSDDEVMDYLRLRTYMLRGNFPSPGKNPRLPLPAKNKKFFPEDIIGAPDLKAMIKEVEGLPNSQVLAYSGNMMVYYAPAEQIPNLLQEIGRLREKTFREVKEGTGKAIDLDRFDAHYLHLFLWNKETSELVGAYRLGCTDRILRTLGSKGLYTATLFDYRGEFLREICPSLELGRSFIRSEYQKNYSALLLLWKGIGQFVVRHPHYQKLFGPVSISNEYNEFSKGLLATWLSMHNFLPELAQFIRPKNPFQVKKIQDQDLRLALTGTREVEELAALMADVDPNQKGVPILLKQYLKLGGKLLGFNRDPDFNDVLDGLILVDLRQTQPKVLQRYMGAEGLEKFRQFYNSPTINVHESTFLKQHKEWEEQEVRLTIF
jgi:putative hemolysin